MNGWWVCSCKDIYVLETQACPFCKKDSPVEEKKVSPSSLSSSSSSSSSSFRNHVLGKFGSKESQIDANFFIGNILAFDNEEFDHVFSFVGEEDILGSSSSDQRKHCYRFALLDDPSEGENFKQILSDVTKRIETILKEDADSKILLHCVEGRSRSPAMLIGVLMKLKRMSFEDAYEKVASKRTISLNSGFVTALREVDTGS